MRIFHEDLEQEVRIKKKYDNGLVTCYLVNQPKVLNVHGKLVYQSIITNIDKLVRIGNGNLEIFTNAC